MKHQSSPKWKYNLIIEGEFEPRTIDLGNAPDWIEKNESFLETASRISLAPKRGEDMPIVTVALDENKHWIFYSQVFGSITSGTGVQFRAYCIGWKLEVVRLDGFDDEAYVGDGRVRSVKSLTWVYPNGTIENGEAPMFAGHFLEAAKEKEGISP